MEINFVNEFPKTLGCVVEYNGKKYLLWHVNSFGKAQLMNPDGTKFSGTPEVAKLKWSTTKCKKITKRLTFQKLRNHGI